MRSKKKIMALATVVFVVEILFPEKTYAYLDPGTGSYALQILLAVLVGGAFAVKQYYNSIKNFLKSKLSKGTNDNDQEKR